MEYKIKFQNKCIAKVVPKNERIFQLIYWCNQLHQEGFLTPYKNLTERQQKMKKQFIEKLPETGSDGNLSFKIDNKRFIITGSHLPTKKDLRPKDFTVVESCEYLGDLCKIKYSGRVLPSSETMLHDLIYKSVDDAGAVFHGHDDVGLTIVNNLLNMGLEPDFIHGAITQRVPMPGTRETPDAVLEVLNSDIKYVIISGHGFVSIGKTMKEAGKLAIDNSRRLREQAKKLGIIE